MTKRWSGYAPSLIFKEALTFCASGRVFDVAWRLLIRSPCTIHTVSAWLLIALIVLHVAGALKHQLIDRDRLIERILP